ncbi:MAG: hypothetical protein IPJ03_18100 [Ignavibacteriales bacterium]|nr:hypothetical protein [Ignavibacteriales bacterium]
MYKVVYIDYNFVDERYPNTVHDGDKFFTYGFGSIYARKFRKYNPDILVECWKVDSRVKKIYEKEIENVKFIVFPSRKIGKFGHYSAVLIKYLKKFIKENPNVVFNISSIRHLLFYSVAIHLRNFPLVIQHHGEASALYKYKINKSIKNYFMHFKFLWSGMPSNSLMSFLY